MRFLTHNSTTHRIKGRSILSLICLLLLACISACSDRRQTAKTVPSVAEAIDSIDFACSVASHYARGFTVDNESGYKRLSILNPEGRDTLAVYILFPRGQKPKLPEPAGHNWRFVSVPLSTLACFSTAELGALPLLGLSERLIAGGNLNYVYDSLLRQRIERGEVVEVAKGFSRDVERLMMLRPDLVLQDNSLSDDRDADLRKLGIELVPFISWREHSLLARAEWLKVIALFFGCNNRAQELFERMEREYLGLCKLLKNQDKTVPILYGQDYKGTWYIPGEHSYVASMLRDAGLHFDYAQGQADSQPMSFEYIFSRYHDRRLWLTMPNVELHSIAELVAQNEHYAHFRATQSGEVWVARKRVNSYGGNDLWESGVYNPQILLKDIIKIAHPKLFPNYEPTYWYALTP